MSNPTVNSALQLLGEKLRQNPDFMAFVLGQFCTQEGVPLTELPSVLEIRPEMVTRLALCRKPDPEAVDFAERVREIAYYTLADEAVLANVIRRVSSIQSLRSAKEEAFLAAARDRELDQKEPTAPRDENEKDET
jgi:hypothetical protein